MPDRLAALDTKVLLGIQAPVPVKSCVVAHKLLKDEKFLFCATPTVLTELERLERKAAEWTRELARNVLQSLPNLDVVYKNFTDTEADVTEIHVNRIIERGILDEKSRGDLSALIEACYADCLLFITTREKLLANRGDLTLALIQVSGMARLYIFSPDEIVSFFEPD